MYSIEQAFRKYRRQNFVPDEVRGAVDFDIALPIGFGQTISQPTTVLNMLGWLEAEPGDHVLDVGSGSGWTTALLSYIVGPHGKVYAVDIIPELVEFGRTNCENAGVKNATFYQASDSYGLPEHAPYDRILVSAAAQNLPTELLDQLKIGGKLVIPVRNDIVEITKTSQTAYDTETHPGYVFVPLVQKCADKTS